MIFGLFGKKNQPVLTQDGVADPAANPAGPATSGSPVDESANVTMSGPGMPPMPVPGAPVMNDLMGPAGSVSGTTPVPTPPAPNMPATDGSEMAPPIPPMPEPTTALAPEAVSALGANMDNLIADKTLDLAPDLPGANLSVTPAEDAVPAGDDQPSLGIGGMEIKDKVVPPAGPTNTGDNRVVPPTFSDLGVGGGSTGSIFSPSSVTGGMTTDTSSAPPPTDTTSTQESSPVTPTESEAKEDAEALSDIDTSLEEPPAAADENPSTNTADELSSSFSSQAKEKVEEALEQDVASQQTAISDLEAQLEQTQASLEKEQTEVASKQEAITEHEKSIAESKEKIETMRGELDSRRAKIAKILEDL